MKPAVLNGSSLTLELLADIAYRNKPVTLAPDAVRAVTRSRAMVEKWVRTGETVYGVTTGFGEFSTVRIEPKDIRTLQENLILSHAAGTGDPLPPEIVRAMMALRINALAKGFSGIRVGTIRLLASMLNRNIVPVIPRQGSVGASGDLVQLAHLVLAMIGKGTVWVDPSLSGEEAVRRSFRPIPARRALKRFGLTPVVLDAKEGLALVNGTQMMTSFTALAAYEARRLCRMADIVASMSVEALRGSDTPFDKRIHDLRPYPGQVAVARNLRALLQQSEIRKSHRYNDLRVQDAYSLRCIPQVHGASRDAVEYVATKMLVEMNSANDNPLIVAREGVYLEGGNFHGQPVALAADFLAIALSELANISERRIERMVNGSLSGLPKFLTSRGGLHSGLMIAQYTAASIVSENKVLCHPGSVDSIPTSANQEDHNSMGSVSAQKLWRVLKNAQRVLGIELLCAAQGIDFVRTMGGTGTLRAGRGVEAAHRSVRRSIRHLNKDRILQKDILAAIALIRGEALFDSVESAIGPLE
jgi:histidine ammonia-lyase